MDAIRWEGNTLYLLDQTKLPVEETWLFEDGLYSIKTAKAEGFKIVGVYDSVSEADQEEIRIWSDIYVRDLSRLSVQSGFLTGGADW